MKMSRKQLRRVIGEELLRVMLIQENQDYFRLKEKTLTEGCGHDQNDMPKAQMLQTLENSERILQMLASGMALEEWMEAKVTKASDYLESVYNSMQGDRLDLEEEMATSDIRLSNAFDTGDRNYAGITDPADPEANNDTWFVNIEQASRILEELPLEELPEQVTTAAQSLRDALLQMITPLD